jgi:hypothetical protein
MGEIVQFPGVATNADPERQAALGKFASFWTVQSVRYRHR